MSQRMIDGGKILLNYRLSSLAIRLLNGLLDLCDSFIARQDAADGEKARLHDGVDARPHPCFTRHPVSVDYIKLNLLPQQFFLYRSRQLVPDICRRKWRVEQEDR